MITLASIHPTRDWSSLEAMTQAMSGAIGLLAVALLLVSVALKRKLKTTAGKQHG